MNLSRLISTTVYFPYFNNPAAQVHGDSPSWSSLSGQTAIIILLLLSMTLMISLLGLGFLHFEAGKVNGLSGLKNIFSLLFLCFQQVISIA